MAASPAEMRAVGLLFARLGASFIEIADAEERGDAEARRGAARETLQLMAATFEVAARMGSPVPSEVADASALGFAEETGLVERFAPPPPPPPPDVDAEFEDDPVLLDACGRLLAGAAGDVVLYDAAGGVVIALADSAARCAGPVPRHCSFCGKPIVPSEIVEEADDPPRVWCSFCRSGGGGGRLRIEGGGFL